MADYSPLVLSTNGWTEIAAADETVVWSVKEGSVLVTTNSSPSERGSILFRPGSHLTVGPGTAVNVRLAPAVPSATISRNSFGLTASAGGGGGGGGGSGIWDDNGTWG